MWDERSLQHKGYIYSEKLAAISLRSQQQAIKNLQAVTCNLKQQVSNKKYVDQVASYSPNYKTAKFMKSHADTFGSGTAWEGSSTDRATSHAHAKLKGVTPGKSIYQSQIGRATRSSAFNDVYLPGTSVFEPSTGLKNLLKEHNQLKSH